MKKKIIFGILIVCIVFILLSIISGSNRGAVSTSNTISLKTNTISSGSVTPGSVSPQCFTAYTNNPILQNGSLFSGANWNDPSVIKDGSQYVMYASAAQNFDFNIKIYRMISGDGITWTLSPTTAVFEKSSNPSAWDGKSVETPAVVKFKDTYYMFYLGYQTVYNDIYSFRTGYATSPDGIHWTRVPGPLLSPSDLAHGAPNFAFNQYAVSEPAPVVYNNKLSVYFTAIGTDASVQNTLQTIGLIQSSDGVHWSAPQEVLKPDQNIYPRSGGWFGFSAPSAVVIKDKMHLFFDVINEKPSWKQVELSHAVSNDGVSGWTEDPTPIFSDSDFSWTKNSIRSSAAYLDGSQLKLWFAGDDGKNLGIGLATCNL